MTITPFRSLDAGTDILVFGGPYSNLNASRALRREAERRGIQPTRVICTGDVVAYCAEPEETVGEIRDWGCHVIAGNCEEQLAAGEGDCGCGFEEGTACDLLAKGWYPFANGRISAESRTWMGQLSRSMRFECGGLKGLVVHGGTEVINRFIFASDGDTIGDELRRSAADLVVAGHAGIPFVARRGGQVWFNPGVIGMPANDGTADVWFGMITATDVGMTLSTHRLAYDHRGAAAAMRRFAYADGYAKSLVTGIWPSFDVLPPVERAETGRRLRPRTMSIVAAIDA